jgi:ABC-type amino acid transport substrate-binding protein
VIQDRGTLRVAYPADRLPFAYRNKFGETVGFDMELIRRMADEMRVDIELIRLDLEDIAGALGSGAADLAVGGLAITPERAETAAYSNPYSHHTIGFLVRDHDRNRFNSLARLRGLSDLTVAIPKTRLFEGPIGEWLPRAELVEVETPRRFLRGELPAVDGLLTSAEAGGAWTLIYPSFSIAIPTDLSFRLPIAFALPRGQPDWLNFVNSWIAVAQSTGTVDRAFERWVLGRDVGADTPRWSVMGDVLGWGRNDEAGAP